jgi:DNA invertase Pin-like site-specific DNA recombinase
MKTEARPGGKRRLVIYCRISDDREGRKYGVKRQERDCRALAKELESQGIPNVIVAVLVENDTSAYSGKPRPWYQELIRMLRDGEADGVLALTSRRLQRRFREAFEFLDLVEEKNLLVATVKGGTYDLTTADGRREARRKAIDDQHEAEETAERVRDAKSDNVREGTYRGGPRPFGYEADGTTPRGLACPDCPSEDFAIELLCSICGTGDGVSPDRVCAQCETSDGFTAVAVCAACRAEAAIAEGSEAWEVGKAMDLIVAGDSLRGICRSWKAKGITTPPRRRRLPDGTRTEPIAGEFSPTPLRRLLLRPRNAGLLEVAGEVVGRAAWPAITSEDKWRACKAILDRPERRNTESTARKWLGGALYRCGWGGCTEAMKTEGRGTGLGTAYQCQTGGHVSRVAAYVDEYVEEWAVERLSRPDAAELLMPPAPEQEPVEQLVAREEGLRAKLAENQRDYDDDLKTRAQYLDSNARLRAKLKELEAEWERRSTVPVLRGIPLGSEQLAQDWKGYSLDRKRAIIDTIMTVTILPARQGRPDGFRPGDTYFDERSVRIEPKRPV